MLSENTILSYWAGNGVRTGLVVRPGRDKLQVQPESGKTDKVAARQVIASQSPGEGDASRALSAFSEAAREAAAEVDCELLWETLPEHGAELDIAALAREYFGGASAVEATALALAIAEEPVLFKRKGNGYVSRTAEEAEEVRRLREMRARKAELRERLDGWIGGLLAQRDGEPVPVPEEYEDFVRYTSDYLLLGHNSDAVNTLSTAHPRRSPREVALEVLRKTGRLPEDADPFLLVNGIHAGFSSAVLSAADALAPYPGDPGRSPAGGSLCFSIDDAETREVDDALSVERDGEDIVVGIHISDPSHFVLKDDSVDRVAAERPLTLYLPTTVVTMLPERIGCDLASLAEGVLRPSLSFRVRFSPDLEMRSWSFECAEITVSRRLSYDDADALLATGGEEPLPAALALLSRVADVLRARRALSGAITLIRPELKVHVSGDEITVKPIDAESPSRGLVSELMILANRLTAEFALSHDVPVIYRVQDPPSEAVPSMTGYDPVDFDTRVRRMKRTRLSTHPQPHSGLGLDLYTQVSSPIRRYTDLVILRQVAARLEGLPLPYEQTELFEVISNADRTTMQNRSLEREATRFWTLEYLLREYKGREVEAVVVTCDGRSPMAEIAEIYERGVLRVRGQVRPGDRIRVRISDVRPRQGFLGLDMV